MSHLLSNEKNGSSLFISKIYTRKFHGKLSEILKTFSHTICEMCEMTNSADPALIITFSSLGFVTALKFLLLRLQPALFVASSSNE